MNFSGDYAIATAGSTASSMPVDPGRRMFAGLVFISLLSAVVATGTTAGTLLDASSLRPVASKTDAGETVAEGTEQVTAIAELRRLTGLTWDQVATLFGVSRRAVHFWVSGKPMASGHDEHLQRTLSCLHIIDNGNAAATRQALFAPLGAGLVPFDLLARREYAKFVASLGRTVKGTRTPTKPTRVSDDRLPVPPQVLASAREESAHREAGPPRRATVVRARRA